MPTPFRLTALAFLALAFPAAAQNTAADLESDARRMMASAGLDSTAHDVILIEDIPTYSAGMGRTDGPFTLVSLDGTVVVAPDAAARADSASGAWDVGIRGTEIILNGGASGPGERRGVLLPFASEPPLAMSGPTGTLLMDGDGECPRGPARVVCHGSGDGWYEYAATGVQPLGRTLVVERPDGSRFQVRFVRYVLGEALPSGIRPRYVTLEVAPVASVETPR